MDTPERVEVEPAERRPNAEAAALHPRVAALPRSSISSPRSSDPPFVSRFSAHVAWTFIARLFMITNSVLAGIIVARWLGVEGVGQLAVINVSVATVVQLATLGLPSANTYFIAQNITRLRTVATNSLVFGLALGVLLAVALSSLASLFPSWFGSVSPGLIRVAAISIPFQLLTLMGLNIFLALGNVRDFNLLDLASQSFVLINALVGLVVLRRNLTTLVALNTTASIIVATVIALLLMIAGRRVVGTSWRSDASLLLTTLKYGIKFHIAIVAGALIFRADLLVVNHFRGPSEAGVYSIASQIGMMLMLLPGVIATLLFPRVTAEQDARGETTCQVTRQTAFTMLLCCVAAVPMSFLLPVLYGQAFSDAPLQLWILLPGVYLVGVESVLVQHFNALGLPRRIPFFWLITLAVNLALVFLLVPRFGARGAAVASTISYTLIFALVSLRFLQTSGRTFADVFILRKAEFRRLIELRNSIRLSSGSQQG